MTYLWGFFNALFTSSNPFAIDNCLCGMNTKVTTDMNSKLLMNFFDLEVKEAVFQMSPLSSPGLDGFPAQFYQKIGISLGKMSASLLSKYSSIRVKL